MVKPDDNSYTSFTFEGLQPYIVNSCISGNNPTDAAIEDEIRFQIGQHTGNWDTQIGCTEGCSNRNTGYHNNGPFQTETEAKQQAEAMGFKEVKGVKSHGAKVYQRGREFISRDQDGHNGGAWKKASSIKNLGKKETRTGTFNRDLSSRVGN